MSCDPPSFPPHSTEYQQNRYRQENKAILHLQDNEIKPFTKVHIQNNIMLFNTVQVLSFAAMLSGVSVLANPLAISIPGISNLPTVTLTLPQVVSSTVREH